MTHTRGILRIRKEKRNEKDRNRQKIDRKSTPNGQFKTQFQVAQDAFEVDSEALAALAALAPAGALAREVAVLFSSQETGTREGVGSRNISEQETNFTFLSFLVFLFLLHHFALDSRFYWLLT